ncbi:unnamed protein product [Brassica oleracea]
MANQQFHLFELKAGLCRQSVVRRLLRIKATIRILRPAHLLSSMQTFIFDNLAMQLLDKLVIHGVEPRVISATNINPKLVGGMHVPD